MSGPDGTLKRRDMLMLTGAATAAAGLGLSQTPQAFAQKAAKASAGQAERAAVAGGARKRFLTQAEFQTLEELAEAIIPADEMSGGAKAAKVADSIDFKLGESIDPAVRQSWRDDLAEINRLAAVMSGKTFIRLAPAERVRLLTRISRNEANPKEAGEYAFGTIKWEVALHYYKSKIGIHDELKYQGNVLLDEFAGTDVGKS